MRHFRSSLPQSEFFRGTVMIASGTGVAQALGILSSPIVTRLYAPSDYGAFAVASTLLAVLISVACIRYDLAVPLPESTAAAANLLALCLVVSAVASLLAVPILWLAGPSILGLAVSSTLGPYVLLLPLGLFSSGALAALGGWMIRTKSYRQIAANRLTQSVTTVGVQIGLGLLGSGAFGLLVGIVAGVVVGLGRLAIVAWRNGADSFRNVSTAGIWAVAARYRRFPLFSAPSAFLNALGLGAPIILVVTLFGPSVGGQFALAQRVIALPVTLLAAAVGQVYFAEAARVARERPGDLRSLFLKVTRTLALTALVPFLLAAILAPLLFGYLFGQDWTEAGLDVAILAPMYYLQFVTTPTGGTLDVLERQDLHLIREIARLILVGGAVAIAALLQFSAVGAIVALSAAGCLTNALYGVFSWRTIVDHAATDHLHSMIDPTLSHNVPRDIDP